MDVSHNSLVSLPDSLCSLRFSLVNLNASNNELETLPDELNKLTALKTLDVSNNKIAVIPEQLEVGVVHKLYTIVTRCFSTLKIS